MDKDTLLKVRGQIETLYTELTTLKDTMTEDGLAKPVLAAFPDYQKENPGVMLNRAERRIAKKGYNICLAGGFSGGKSSIINSLLEEPTLLATEAGECTMSVTFIAAPERGEGEHVAVRYFSKEDALKNVIQNSRYVAVFGAKAEELIADAAEDKIVAAIKENAGKLASATDTEDRKRGAELKEFLEYMNKYADRLGKEFTDEVKNSGLYLTTDKHSQGLGHLMLIESVAIYRNNRMFVENGIRVVDLPGTDSPNERQKELTHQAMADADVVLLTLEPKGFKMADVLIGKELGKHYGKIRNKVFIVVNKFDTLDSAALTKDQIEKLYKGQMMEQIIKAGFNPERVYFTSAKYALLHTIQAAGKISKMEKTELKAMHDSMDGKLKNIDRAIMPEIIEKMEYCYKDGGINFLRDDLLKYLESEVQKERLADIYTDLKAVYDITASVLTPERGKIKDLIEKQKNMSVRILEFADEIQKVFNESLGKFETSMDGAMKKLLQKVYERIKSFSVLIDKVNFDTIAGAIAMSNTHKIKIAIIDKCKEKFGEALLESVIENTVYPVTSRIKEESDKTNIEKICRHFSSEKANLGQAYADMHAAFAKQIKFVAELRAKEEVWRITNLAITPSGSPTGPWGAKEQEEFRGDIKRLFNDKCHGAVKTLENVLPQYFNEIIRSLRADFQEIMTEMTLAIRSTDNVNLPLDLIYQDGSDDTNQKQKIVKYIMHLDKAGELMKSINDLNLLK
ncbi:MAG: dynamin family protein [Planctomycetota bacterium]